MRVEFSKIIDFKKHPRVLKAIGKNFFSPDALARTITPLETTPLIIVKPATVIEFPSTVLDFSDFSDFGDFELVDDSVNAVLDQRSLEVSEESSQSLVAQALKFKDEQQIIYSAIMGTVYESASSGAEGGCGPCGGDGGTSASGGKESSEGKGGNHEHCKCGAEITSSGYCENGHKV